MKKTLIAFFGFVLATQSHAGGNAWGTASDLLAAGLPTLAAGYTYLNKDVDGGLQLAWSLGATIGTTELLKNQISETRPDGSDNKSFPSGHTAVAFASARYLHKRYEGEVNPYLLYGAASLTALARVQADKHHWKDTIAGGALGYAWSEYFTDAKSGTRIGLAPTPRGMAVTWQRPW